MRATALLLSALLLAACTEATGEPEDVRPAARPPPAEATTAPPAAPVEAATTALATTTIPAERADERERMVERHMEPRGISDPDVLEAMRSVPRHRFVPDAYESQAYGDHPLPIGSGQTISQPYIVALMTEMLGVDPGDKVLEIGTGSGYQAAVLAAMGVDVYTIEIIPELAQRAAAALDETGYAVTTRTGDGYFGWPEHAPFDAIIVTAAPDHVPQPLVEQLADGGRMVIPVGPIGAVQTLWQFTVDETGELIGRNLGAVRFVPFTREEG